MIPPELLDDLNYLNTAEIKSFCKRHSIPYTITVETADGARRKTRDDDRKGVVLDRIRHFLQTGVVPEATCFAKSVVNFDPPPRKLTADDRLYYGQYDKENRAMLALLKELTGGQFEDGAVARMLARELWTAGEAPTFRSYATKWLHMTKNPAKAHPEWAFLADRASKKAPPDWKKLREAKARKVLAILDAITER